MKDSEAALLKLLNSMIDGGTSTEFRQALGAIVRRGNWAPEPGTYPEHAAYLEGQRLGYDPRNDTFTIQGRVGRPENLLRQDLMVMAHDADRYRTIRPIFAQLVCERHPAYSQNGVDYMRSIEYNATARGWTTDPNSVDQAIDTMRIPGVPRDRLSPYAPPYRQPYEHCLNWRPDYRTRMDEMRVWVDETAGLNPGMLNRIRNAGFETQQRIDPYPTDHIPPSWRISAED